MGGYAGFSDKVNNHYLRIFGSGFSAFGLLRRHQFFAAAGQQRRELQQLANHRRSLGQQMGQIGMQMAQLQHEHSADAPKSVRTTSSTSW